MRLGVNIDHIATLRQARGGSFPDPLEGAFIAQTAGADGIVCHLREDRRHIQDRDLHLLKKTVYTHLNLEMAVVQEMINIALQVLPEMVTMVPEKRKELTTEGGLDLIAGKVEISKAVNQLKKEGITVSAFIDANIHQVREAAEIGFDFVELHTGSYAEAKDELVVESELEKIGTACIAASKLGLGVSAGHGLNYHNVKRIKEFEIIEELNIGHSIISRALFTGLDKAVRDMIEVII